MHKRYLRSYLGKVRLIPRFGFLAVATVFLIIGVFAYRQNNVRMLELREAVFQADEEGGDVESALQELRRHVYSHMNTDLAAGENAIRPPIQLKYTYERLVAKEQAAKAQGGNQDLYTEAQNYCERTQPAAFYGRDRLPCIRDYLDRNGVETANTDDVQIPSELYKFDFASPAWTFDLAGWSFIISALAFGLFILRLLAEQIIRRQLDT